MLPGRFKEIHWKHEEKNKKFEESNISLLNHLKLRKNNFFKNYKINYISHKISIFSSKFSRNSKKIISSNFKPLQTVKNPSNLLRTFLTSFLGPTISNELFHFFFPISLFYIFSSIKLRWNIQISLYHQKLPEKQQLQIKTFNVFTALH